MKRASPQCPYMRNHLNHLKYKSYCCFCNSGLTKEQSEMFEEKKITYFGPQLQLWASWTRNPRISSLSSKVSVISMSNAAGGCSQMSQASGRSGCLILMALSSANLDFVMSTLLQSRPLPSFEGETMKPEKKSQIGNASGTYFRKKIYQTTTDTTNDFFVGKKVP